MRKLFYDENPMSWNFVMLFVYILLTFPYKTLIFIAFIDWENARESVPSIIYNFGHSTPLIYIFFHIL